MATRISLKELATLRSNLKYYGEDIDAIKEGFKDTTRKTNNPGVYGATEQYVQINELGPVVDNLIDGVKALEAEMEEVQQFLGEQIGRSSM